MSEYILPLDLHDQIANTAYRHRGFTDEEAAYGASMARSASWHGIKTHNLIKALKLDDLFGSQNKVSPGCVPGAKIQRLDTGSDRFLASQRWNANRKLGQAVAVEAIQTCMDLADRYGVGMVSVDQAFHYLWGGGYVMDAAEKGYIAYTNCTASLAEVVPFQGSFPTLGTNPHSWGFPTRETIGFPIVIDWATSTIATGRVEVFKREGRPLPVGSAVDKDGNPTTNPNNVAWLLPFGGHKGYSLALINELVAAMIGGSLPTIRSRPELQSDGEKIACNFFFQVIHPDALSCGAFAMGRNQSDNVAEVIRDVLGHGNKSSRLPGQIEHEAAKLSQSVDGLIFTEAEIDAIEQIALGCGTPFDRSLLRPLN